MTSKMSNGYADASIDQAGSISGAKEANIDARNAAISLRDGIKSLNQELSTTITLALDNPFFKLDKGAKELAKSTKEVAQNVQQIGGQARPLGPNATDPVLMQRTPSPTLPNAPQTITGQNTSFDAIKQADDTLEATKAQQLFNFQLQQTQAITGLLAPAFDSVIQAMVMGEDIGKSLEAYDSNDVGVIEVAVGRT